MEYLSVKQAAKKWEISERLAQRYCAEGRIEGVVKFSGSWAIPIDAEKPEDPRKSSEKSQEVSDSSVQFPCRVAMPLLNTAYKLGHCLETIENFEDEDTKGIAYAEYYYFSGQSEKASDIAEKYLTHQEISIKLSACWLYAYANLALNRISKVEHAMAQVNSTLESVNENTPLQHKALTVCVSTGASVLLHLPLPKILTPLKEYIYLMPPGLRLFVLYIQAHHAYINKQYGACIGIAETALAIEGELYPIPTIYLHLVATMGYINLRHREQATQHILEAWKIAQSDNMIEPFGEHHGLLGGMLEAVIKKEWPDDFKRMISITYSFSAGWRKIHNSVTGRSVADNLTTTEFTAAMLAAREWTNKEIAAHMNVSENTVKRHISTALQKLNISQRKELKNFMLH